MKSKFSFTVALWWIILCVIAGFFLIVATNKQSRLSETENRMLAAFPEANVQTLTSGEFMSGFEDFLSDAFFARDNVVRLTNGLLDRFSTLSEDEKLVVEAKDMERRMATEGINPAVDPDAAVEEDDGPSEEIQADGAVDADGSGDAPQLLEAPAEETAPESESPAIVADNDEDAPDDGGDGLTETDDDAEGGELSVDEGAVPVTAKNCFMWLEKKDGKLEKIYTFKNSDVATFGDTLKMYLDYLPPDGRVLFTQVPLASIGNRWAHAQRSVVGWGSSVELVLEKYLEGEDRIMVFNTMEILEPYMAQGQKLFYETDHHWSAEGAYLVAAEMIRRLGFPVTPYEEYVYKSNRSRERNGHQDVFNFLYPLLPTNSYVITKKTHSTEISFMNYKSHTYLGYLNNSRFPWRRIVTGANTGRKALVICDSFGNDFTPYLLPYYDEVHMTDPRSEYHSRADRGASIGELIEYHKIDDVYIVLSTANGLRKKNALVYLRKYLTHR